MHTIILDANSILVTNLFHNVLLCQGRSAWTHNLRSIRLYIQLLDDSHILCRVTFPLSRNELHLHVHVVDLIFVKELFKLLQILQSAQMC